MINSHFIPAVSGCGVRTTLLSPSVSSLHTSPSIFTKNMLDFNFGSAPVDSDPSDFMLMFHNPGCIPVHWYVNIMP